MVPDTVQQLTILLVLVLPGVFYQAVRERLRGASPAEREPQNRLLRAIAAGVILDGVYAVIAGPWPGGGEAVGPQSAGRGVQRGGGISRAAVQENPPA